MNTGFIVAALAAGLLAAPAAAQAAANAYLYIDGVRGEATDPDHKGWIELVSYTVDAQPGRGGGATGAAGGRVSTSEITVSKHTDTASPSLMSASATGRHFPSGELDVVEAGGATTRYKLTDVIIASDHTSGGGADQPTESLSLNFSKILIEYPPRQTTTRPGWDAVAPSHTTMRAPR